MREHRLLERGAHPLLVRQQGTCWPRRSPSGKRVGGLRPVAQLRAQAHRHAVVAPADGAGAV
uniref:Uncharacterized protein n=1 Tax=Oryza sativa subsp. japonica TaxID=39947 RepID=Q6K1V4_ORYSJ|nr:hypothetical protein [Oryza sativa Japonica Group]